MRTHGRRTGQQEQHGAAQAAQLAQAIKGKDEAMGAAVAWKAKCHSLQAELEETQFESRRMRQRVALGSQPATLVPQPKQLAAGQSFLVPPAPAQMQRPVHVAASPQKAQEAPARASGIESLTAPLVQKRQALAAAAPAKARESSAKDVRSARVHFPHHTPHHRPSVPGSTSEVGELRRVTGAQRLR